MEKFDIKIEIENKPPMVNNGVKVANTPPRGRGVVATRKFKKGEILEIAPVFVFPAKDDKLIGETKLNGYTFRWGDRGKLSALAMGCGSFYNHSYDANAKYQGTYEDDTIEFLAVKDIEAGEEITINYNGSPKNKKPVWFDVV
jgi:SET domain-containing protein